jgi:transcriptional regulator with XRE-family HTH domain
MSDLTQLVVGPGEPDNAELGEILERYRINAELSRRAAAAQLELSSEYVRLVERGKRTFTLGMMPKVLSIYDITYELELDRIVFDRYSVQFSSRIREARYKDIERPNRDERLGQIVRLLAITDEETLDQIYRRLLRG